MQGNGRKNKEEPYSIDFKYNKVGRINNTSVLLLVSYPVSFIIYRLSKMRDGLGFDHPTRLGVIPVFLNLSLHYNIVLTHNFLLCGLGLRLLPEASCSFVVLYSYCLRVALKVG